MMTFYNMRNPAVKRLMKEAEELRHPTEEYHAQPLEDNLFEWHFTLRGPPNSDFEGGIYHGRITLPSDYPMKPPSIILLTPNGRFETNKKICLSISGHHPESWQPSWSIRTALLAIIGFMPTHGNGALGSLDYTPEERRQLAAKSQEFKCPECGLIKDIFLKKEYFGSPQKFQSSNILPDPPDELEKNENIITAKLTTELSSDDYSEKSAAEEMNEIKDGTSLVHRHKNLESSIVKEETKQLTTESGSNRLYSALIFKNENIITAKLTTELSSDDYSKKSAAEEMNEIKDGTSLVHRHKNLESSIVKEETKQLTTESGSNRLYSALIFVIVAIMSFLCLRRIFSM